MINFAVCGYLIVLAVSISHFHLWLTMNWWVGLLCGAVTAVAWPRSKGVAVLLTAVGIFLWMMIFTGKANGLAFDSRSFFNGMSLGFLLGWTGNLFFYWPHSGQKIKRIAEFEGTDWMLRLLSRFGIK